MPSNGFSLRTTVLRLTDDSLALFSPTRGLQTLIAELGSVSMLVAPNHFHHLGLASYAERWPDATIVCSSQAAKRLSKKSAIQNFQSLDALRALLPAHASVLEAPSLRTGEILLRVETELGVAWAVSDAFFNLAAHPRGMAGLVCRATRTSKGMRIGRTFTGLAVQDKQTYGAWLRQQLDADRPTLLLPGHGEVQRGSDVYPLLDGETRARLRA